MFYTWIMWLRVIHEKREMPASHPDVSGGREFAGVVYPRGERTQEIREKKGAPLVLLISGTMLKTSEANWTSCGATWSTGWEKYRVVQITVK